MCFVPGASRQAQRDLFLKQEGPSAVHASPIPICHHHRLPQLSCLGPARGALVLSPRMSLGICIDDIHAHVCKELKKLTQRTHNTVHRLQEGPSGDSSNPFRKGNEAIMGSKGREVTVLEREGVERV